MYVWNQREDSPTVSHQAYESNILLDPCQPTPGNSLRRPRESILSGPFFLESITFDFFFQKNRIHSILLPRLLAAKSSEENTPKSWTVTVLASHIELTHTEVSLSVA